jgi:4-hydroxy-3-methylbut-2-enyl diphosphate reductase
MGVKLARNAGFCMGVKRAMDIVLDIARHMGDEEVYTYGPLIHNPQTMGLLKKRGITPLDRIDDIEKGTVIIRAHGISPQERGNIKAKGIKIIDATCPKVANVQSIIKKHATQDYAILIVGDREHPEVKGLLGYAQGKGRPSLERTMFRCFPIWARSAWLPKQRRAGKNIPRLLLKL